jgi:GDPmannose 4,6-dehydratase
MVAACRHEQPLDFVLATGASHSVEEFVEVAFAALNVLGWRPTVEFSPRSPPRW